MGSVKALKFLNPGLVATSPDTRAGGVDRRPGPLVQLPPRPGLQAGAAAPGVCSESLWELFGSCVLIRCLWQGSWQEKAVEKQRHQGGPSQVRMECEERSHVAQPVSFQQDLIKASNTVGRRFRADVSIAQWRLSAVKLYRTLRQRSDGRDSSLSLCCLDSVAAGAAHGEREAGEDHQLPPEATSTHGGVGQDQSQGPEAGYCPQEPGLCLGQWQGTRETGDLRRVLFFHTIQFFRSQEGHSNSPLLPRAFDDRGSCVQPLDVLPSQPGTNSCLDEHGGPPLPLLLAAPVSPPATLDAAGTLLQHLGTPTFQKLQRGVSHEHLGPATVHWGRHGWQSVEDVLEEGLQRGLLGVWRPF